jgi:hypothetical protein
VKSAFAAEVLGSKALKVPGLVRSLATGRRTIGRRTVSAWSLKAWLRERRLWEGGSRSVKGLSGTKSLGCSAHAVGPNGSVGSESAVASGGSVGSTGSACLESAVASGRSVGPTGSACLEAAVASGGSVGSTGSACLEAAVIALGPRRTVCSWSARRGAGRSSTGTITRAFGPGTLEFGSWASGGRPLRSGLGLGRALLVVGPGFAGIHATKVVFWQFSSLASN